MFFFMFFYMLSTVTKLGFWYDICASLHSKKSQADTDVTRLKKVKMWFAMMWLGWGSLSHVPDATARQQQKQLQQQRHEQQMLRQQRLFEGAFGAASDRHGGHVNHPFTLLSWKLVVSLLPWQNRGYGWSKSFSGFKLSPYGAIAVESLQESMSFSKSSY